MFAQALEAKSPGAASPLAWPADDPQGRYHSPPREAHRMREGGRADDRQGAAAQAAFDSYGSVPGPGLRPAIPLFLCSEIGIMSFLETSFFSLRITLRKSITIVREFP